MKDRNYYLQRLTMAADLPSEPLPGLPLVELAGDCRVLIERHQGVIAYGCSEICVKVCYGQLHVCGSGLELARMTKEQLVITGRIDAISLHRRK